MTNDETNPKSEHRNRTDASFRAWGFVIPSDFDIRHSSFPAVVKISSSAFTALRSWVSEIINGGVKLIILEYSPSGSRMNPRWSMALIARSDAAVAGEPSF